MAFWDFHQNNSFGIMDSNETVQHHVVIEALNAEDANARMREIVNSYVQSGDCPCCGDRWYIYAYGKGDSVPLVYGESILLYENNDILSESVAVSSFTREITRQTIDTVVYYLDGTKSFGQAPSLW